MRPAAPKAASPGLRAGDFRQVARNGWNDPYNSYAHSMAWFKGHLYVGSTRANLHLIRLRKPPPQWKLYPVPTPTDPYTLDLRAQIWRYDPGAATWEQVHRSPFMKDQGNSRIPREIGTRGMAVFRGRSEAAPALYVSTFGSNRGPGARILRCEDGRHFLPVGDPGLGIPGVAAFRSLVTFRDRLYTSPIGATRKSTIQHNPNFAAHPVVLESDDPARGRWRPVSLAGFGNPDNTAVFELAAFADHLYATTFNCATGFELWKTNGLGHPPYRWKRVLASGAGRGVLNEGGLCLSAFNDALYVGTGIQDGGYDRAKRIGPAAGELIRVFPDDSWELLVGEERRSPRGLMVPASGLGPGFGNFFNGYLWRSCVHEGWLYMGTFDWSGFLPYLPVANWPAGLRTRIEAVGIERLVRWQGGFDLWRTRDGVRWSLVTQDGFGNKYNAGVRTMVSTPRGLFLGTANPFGPKVAVPTARGWGYAPNPHGGLEIWLGSTPFAHRAAPRE